MQYAFDVIGDIHGHASALHSLLGTLGYSLQDGVYRHPDRRVVFLGDFVDRGHQQREVYETCHRMCDAGSAFAVMGNHEFNAIGWFSKDEAGAPLREHSSDNFTQHKDFLNAVCEGSSYHQSAIDWFKSLPLWIEFPGIRFVHACWHSASQVALTEFLNDDHTLTTQGLHAAHVKGTSAHHAVEVLLKGPEILMPNGEAFRDSEGKLRRHCRVKWWDRDASSIREAVITAPGKSANLLDTPFDNPFSYRDEIPVFFGHYWLTGKPRLLSPHTVCLDYSVARGGPLVAYRWTGEATLKETNLIYEPGCSVAN